MIVRVPVMAVSGHCDIQVDAVNLDEAYEKIRGRECKTVDIRFIDYKLNLDAMKEIEPLPAIPVSA
jgi:hypothetical protein